MKLTKCDWWNFVTLTRHTRSFKIQDQCHTSWLRVQGENSWCWACLLPWLKAMLVKGGGKDGVFGVPLDGSILLRAVRLPCRSNEREILPEYKLGEEVVREVAVPPTYGNILSTFYLWSLQEFVRFLIYYCSQMQSLLLSTNWLLFRLCRRNAVLAVENICKYTHKHLGEISQKSSKAFEHLVWKSC